MQRAMKKLMLMVVAGSMSATAAFGQPNASSPKPASPDASAGERQKNTSPAAEPGEIVTFDFPGGTVNDFIAMLREAMKPTPLNVFIESEAAKQPVPPVKLRDAYFYPVLLLLNQSDGYDSNSPVRLSVTQANTMSGQTPIFTISARKVGGENTDRFSVLSLNPIIGLPGSTRVSDSKLDAKTVLAAVEAAVVVSGDEDSPPPMLKFHEASGLLFVKGTNSQRVAADDVVRQLRKDVQEAKAAARSLQSAGTEKRLNFPESYHKAILAALHQRFDGTCCIQFVFEGTTLRITGDKEILDEAAAIAFNRGLQLGEAEAAQNSK